MTLGIGRAGSGFPVRPLCVFYWAGSVELANAAGPRTTVLVGATKPFGTFHENNLPLDELVARFGGVLGVEGFYPIVLAGYSAGVTAVRTQLKEQFCPPAVIAIDGTHASDPPIPWQIDVWRDYFKKCGAEWDGDHFVENVPRDPERPIALVTCSQVVPPTFLGTRATLELVTGWDLKPRGQMLERRSGNLTVRSYPGAGEEHVRQATVVLPAAVREVAAELGMRTPTGSTTPAKAIIRPPASGCPLPKKRGNMGTRLLVAFVLGTPAGYVVGKEAVKRWRNR